MQDDSFEWDDTKATTNRRRHGIDFALATLTFDDAFAVDRLDDRMDYGEERNILIGRCRDMILHVTWTQRGERVRIISARRAERHEQQDYHRQNSR